MFAVEQDHVLGCESELRDHLVAACAGADDGEALSLYFQAFWPPGRVEGRALEVEHAFDLGQLRTVQEADGGDDPVRPQHSFAVGSVDRHVVHSDESSSHASERTSVSKTMSSRSPWVSAIQWK